MQDLVAAVCDLSDSCSYVQMRTLQRLNERHLWPIIEKLQEPKAAILKRQICQRDIDSLTTLKDLMGPFIREFSQTAHALRRQAFQVLLETFVARILDTCDVQVSSVQARNLHAFLVRTGHYVSPSHMLQEVCMALSEILTC
jgi:hypothetical protein